MKYNIFLAVSFLLSSLHSETQYHPHGQTPHHHTRQSKMISITQSLIENPLPLEEIEMHPGDTICYDNLMIPKTLFYFENFYSISIEEFITKIITHHAKVSEEEKQKLIANIKKMTPESAWVFLNDQEFFDEDFIKGVNVIYNQNKFILIYRTRLTIEFLIFAFNIKEKNRLFPYTYCQNMKLKIILENIQSFINYYEKRLLEINGIDEVHITQFKRFLEKYLKMSPKNISLGTFLQELSQFKNFVQAFSRSSNKNDHNPSYVEKYSIFNRFSDIIKI